MFEQIREELAKQFKRDKETITLDTALSEDLRADSLDVMELLMTMEEKYGVGFFPDISFGAGFYFCKMKRKNI